MPVQGFCFGFLCKTASAPRTEWGSGRRIRLKDLHKYTREDEGKRSVLSEWGSDFGGTLQDYVSLAMLGQQRRMMSRLSSFDQRGLWLHDQREKKEEVKSSAATQKHLLQHTANRANLYSRGLFSFDYINQDEFQLKRRENVLHTVTLLVSTVKQGDKTESRNWKRPQTL